MALASGAARARLVTAFSDVSHMWIDAPALKMRHRNVGIGSYLGKARGPFDHGPWNALNARSTRTA
jgi:hypothetical protein